MKRVLVSLFFISSLLVTYIIYITTENKNQEYLDSATERYSRALKTAHDEKRVLADMLFSGLSMLGNIGSHLYSVHNSPTDFTKNAVRKSMHALMKERFAKLNKLGVKHVHIHLANNESFLRMHAPDRYGDDLSSYRPSVVYANKYKKRVDTFEMGRMCVGLRFIYPVIHKGVHVGSMEVSFKVSAITKAIMQQYYVLSNFFIKSSLADNKSLGQVKKRCKPSHHKGYYFDLDVLKELKNVSRKDMSELKPKKSTTDKLYAMGQKDTASSLYSDDVEGVITVIPIVNSISAEKIAFLTVRSKDEQIANSIVFMYGFMVLSIIALSSLFFVLYVLWAKKESLYKQAHFDTLTGLPNRLWLEKKLAFMKKSDPDKPFGVFFIDIDKFKHINDSLGHDVGDLVLKESVRRISLLLGRSDYLGRLGSDEFILICSKSASQEFASNCAQKILDCFSKPFHGKSLYVTASLGVVLYPQQSDDIDNLIKYADTAMYRSKSEGRNHVTFYNKEMTDVMYKRVKLENSIRDALKNQEFLVYFQPQYNVKTQKIHGAEALIRWHHPTRGMVSPGEFLPVAMDSGAIIDMDKWVIATAMEQFATWYKEGLNPGVLSANITMRHLMQKDFVDFIKAILKEFELPADRFKLEITETQVMLNAEEIILKLNHMNEIGVKIAVDDFGTGYSSLSYLKKLPIETLKIDRSFIMDLFTDRNDLQIVKTIINLAKNLELSIIAEGVEEKEQADLLVSLGCECIQGFYFSRPVANHEFEILLQGNR